MISSVNRQTALYSAQKANSQVKAQEAKPQAQAQAMPSESVQISAPQDGFNLQSLMAETAKEAASLEKKLPEHVENEVIVKLKPEFAFDEAKGENTPAGCNGRMTHHHGTGQFSLPELLRPSQARPHSV